MASRLCQQAGMAVIGIVASVALAHPGHDRRATPDGDNFGRVLFKTSCTPAAQKGFERALAMLHSFFFPETVKAFTAVAEMDPDCAIAWWGISISQRPNPLVGPFDAATLKRGWDAVQKGKSIGAKTERERDWILAIETFYKDFDRLDQDTRTRNYTQAMERLAQKYPADVEARIFYGLALNESLNLKDKSYANQRKAAALLEPIERQFPDHPGAAHYLIHSLDYTPLAKQAVPAARRYAKIAASAPHALHMPSHIFSMLGMWDESIEANLRATKAGQDYIVKHKLEGVFPHDLHNYDFIIYAYLQLGQDAKAKEVADTVAGVKKIWGPPRPALGTGVAAVGARYVLERQDWAGAARLPQVATTFPPAVAITHFARGMGAARTGDIQGAAREVAAMKEQRTRAESMKLGYWAEQIEIQILCVEGWIAHSLGDRESALKFMRAAADVEDASEKHVLMENRLYPMRELLGDMLLAMGHGLPALKEYEASMQSTPNRLRGWYGAMKAAQAIGDREKAASFAKRLTRLTRNADWKRMEIGTAKQLIAQR